MSHLTNDYGNYLIQCPDGKVIGSVGLGEDERCSTIISTIDRTIAANKERLNDLQFRLLGCAAGMEDEDDHHSDIMLSCNGVEILRLKHIKE